MFPSKLLSQEWAKLQEQRIADYLQSFDTDAEDNENEAVGQGECDDIQVTPLPFYKRISY